ncbi:hypothetical protein HN011_012490 [Eciton burchellii]|nr:hypothetical protein HN011_012490 [Eciton burchellii]
MEDEDGENKLIDMWNILEEQQLKDTTLRNSLKHSIDDIYADEFEEEKQLMHYNSILTKDTAGKNIITTGPKLIFKGYKKRILSHDSTVPRHNAQLELQLTHSNSKSGKDKKAEGKRERKITEYAQYLGLQPSARYKCSKCHTLLNGPNSKNSCTCNINMTPMPSTSESSTSMPHASNFKITRKVYLCSACGTYFENWNLFLHMRDIHKRHICLFCLGMFGQAERLSYHLLKKHNVPEMIFNSNNDFHNVFKGSCYLVCCNCEKVFSETDNFYNHYCVAPLKEDTIDTSASTCTLCRQTGTHASTCNFALLTDTDKESYGATTPLTIDATRIDDASPVVIPPTEKTTNFGGKGLPRKIIKPNRTKHGVDVIQNPRQQKSNTFTRKFGPKTRCSIETQSEYDTDVQREIANNLPRDTVTETIMEVSRYTGGDTSEENDENDEQAMNKDVHNRDRGLGDKSPVQNHQLDRNEPYDSVTETIMEVSRYIGEEGKNEREDSTNMSSDIRALSHVIEKTNTKEVYDKDDVCAIHASSSRASSPWETNENTTDMKTNIICESEKEFELQSYGSPQDVQSPNSANTSRSLFSPQHELHSSEPQSNERECFIQENDKEEKKALMINATESQASVSSNTVAFPDRSSDRSLVIKICNRNSQFSVATTIVNRESEENNNADRSTSKNKMSNGSGREADNGSDQANELDDSDSDSDKLAVVDSNPEDEEVEDGEEAEETEDTKNRRDYVNDKVQEQNNGSINEIEMETNETFTIGGMIDDDAIGKQLDNNRTEETTRNIANEETKNRTIDDDGITLAGEDVPCVDLNVEGTLDSMELEDLLKRCIDAASPICVYCNHARYIAVNGKQLGLHMLAEHRFQPQHPAIIIHMDQFITRMKRSLDDLEAHYFNLNTYNSTRGMYNIPDVLIYECFHCRFYSAVHKELYLHNRKMHQKTILICIMCKSTFYSYSELLCHLCPGIYSPNVNLRYRCCLCSVNSLPSSFRLMVHLRKGHHTCDVCLESTGNQQRLSNHVWKHKLHHLCYRCGIAYRNKPDITKHLFWKHGTESVLCRKCLQKKWPHIYHFCIPPTAFVCEECGSSFSRAVALKVHKRLHSGDLPYDCDECTERFISRKLLTKHQMSHREPQPEDEHVNVIDIIHSPLRGDKDERSDKDKTQRTTLAIDVNAATGIVIENTTKNVKETVKKVVDVYDLPPLNLSSESDTDNEEEKVPLEKPLEKDKSEDIVEGSKPSEGTEKIDDNNDIAMTNDIIEVERNEEEKKQEALIMDGIWDNFKTYAASLDVEESAKNVALKESISETDIAYLRNIVLADHDYHVIYSDKEKSEDQTTSKDDDVKKEQEEHNIEKSGKSPSPSSPNRTVGCDSDANKQKIKSPKKKKRSGSTSSSDSSSDTDSSSCSCGTNCSCSGSSSGSSSSSSSSSDSDSSTSESSPRKQITSRKERNKKEREAARDGKSQSIEPIESKEVIMENGPMIPEMTSEPPMPPAKLLLRESDLETEETETDEDFYDEYPQLVANKLLAEKRNLLLLAAVAPAATEPAPSSMPLNNGVLDAETTLSEPIAAVTAEDQQAQQQKKRTKTKKRRKTERGSGRRNVITTASTTESIKLNIPKAFYQKNPGFAASSPVTLQPPGSRSSTPSLLPMYNDHHGSGIMNAGISEMTQQQTSSITGMLNQNSNLAETENKRVSKRKRVPKRFYGDSSDDETQNFNKWRKTETNIANVTSTISAPPVPMALSPLVSPKSAPSKLSFSSKTNTPAYASGSVQVEQSTCQRQTLAMANTLPIVTASLSTESEDAESSNSDNSESEIEDTANQSKTSHLASMTMTSTATASVGATSTAERPVKIYCYCQCPYDEVSEMIACDGADCRIEWFHFECVGIMVPPKGKWYCPDCRKKYGILQNSDEYCD